MTYHYEVVVDRADGPDDFTTELVWEGQRMKDAQYHASKVACSRVLLVMEDNGHLDSAEMPKA